MRQTKAFTLVELSIVILIIGLIIGGITAGSSLIQQARLRAIISEFSNLKSAVNLFKVQFNNALPGDISNASNNWSSAVNGNGDGLIGNGQGNDQMGEGLQAFAHLSYASLIAGNFNGTSAGTPAYQPGVNLPGSKFSPIAIYYLYYHNAGTGIYGFHTNFISLASNTSNPWSNGIINSTQAYTIDIKMDDGLAATGGMLTFRGDDYQGQAGKCVSNDWYVPGATYVFSDMTTSCRIIYAI
jgi:prepilin-type N-terminal cleavage/methylation domain-containing protein